eukprot:SAG22_NODE_1558_length_4129_cov_2.138213_1_plen_259_part_00
MMMAATGATFVAGARLLVLAQLHAYAAQATAAPPDDELIVEYTVSALALPAGVSERTVAAMDGRLAAVRERVGTLASAAVVAESESSDLAVATIRVEWGVTASPGSYVLHEHAGTVLLTVRENDSEGLLAGIGRLARELRVEHRSSRAHLPKHGRWEHDASTALWPMRGHQVSTAHYPSSLKTWPEFSRFVSDLAVFGTTQIEVAHIVPTISTKLPLSALVNMSAALDTLGLNFSGESGCLETHRLFSVSNARLFACL